MFHKFVLVPVCVALMGVVAGCTFQPPPPKAPETVVASYVKPSLTPVIAGSETQEKGGVVVQMAPTTFSVEQATEKVCTKQPTTIVQNNQYPYDVVERPSYRVPEELLSFKVKVTNRTEQVLKLAGTIFKLNVNDEEIALDQEGCKTFTDGILTPGQQKEYDIVGPPWRNLPAEATVHFSVFGLGTEMDEAGEITKRENFDWTFAFRAEEVREELELPVATVYMTEAQAATDCGTAPSDSPPVEAASVGEETTP